MVSCWDAPSKKPPGAPSMLHHCKLANDTSCALSYLYAQKPTIVHGSIKDTNRPFVLYMLLMRRRPLRDWSQHAVFSGIKHGTVPELDWDGSLPVSGEGIDLVGQCCQMVPTQKPSMVEVQMQVLSWQMQFGPHLGAEAQEALRVARLHGLTATGNCRWHP